MISNERDSDKSIIPWLLLIVIVAALTTIPYFIVFNGSLSPFHNDWIAFGEYVGGLTGTFLSLIAVLLIFFTYRLQQRELKNTNAALQSQHEQMQNQQHIQMLFSLLERKDKFIDSLTFEVEEDSSKKEYHGVKALNAIYLYLVEELVKISNTDDSTSQKRKDFIIEFFLSEAYQFAQYIISFKASIEYFDSIKAMNDVQKKTNKDLINLYSSYFSIEEESIINYLFEYYRYNKQKEEQDNKRIEIIENFMQKVHELNVIMLSERNREFLGLDNKEDLSVEN